MIIIKLLRISTEEITYFCIKLNQQMAKGLVIIPTYNEIENIEAIITAVFASEYSV